MRGETSSIILRSEGIFAPLHCQPNSDKAVAFVDQQRRFLFDTPTSPALWVVVKFEML